MINSFKLKLKKLFWKFWGLIFLSWLGTVLFFYLTAPRIPIIGFHNIIDRHLPPNEIIQNMDYYQEDLATLLEYLITHNYWFITTQELYDYFLIHSQPIPKEHINQQPIMISFDDSYKSYYTHLLPILEKLYQKYNKKATMVLFINPGTMAKPNKLSGIRINCQELRDGFAKGYYDIQSHGLTHQNLTELDTNNLINEIAQSQQQLKECTAGLDPNNLVAKHLAYPFGAANQQVQTIAAKYHQSSYLYNSQILKFCSLKNYYIIPRLSANLSKKPQRLIQIAKRAYVITKKNHCSHEIN